MKAFFDLLNQLPPERQKFIKGYSPEEIQKIEVLYEIKVTGQLRELLLVAGRCAGGLSENYPIELYDGDVRRHLINQAMAYKELQAVDECTFEDAIFIIGAYDEYYAFLKVGKNNHTDYIFQYDGNTNTVTPMNMTLCEFLLWSCKGSISERIWSGELLNIYREPLEESYLSLTRYDWQQAKLHTYFHLLSQLPPENQHDIKGYTSDEIRQIEILFNIKVTGQLREWLSVAGRCDGGLTSETPIVLYKNNWTGKKHLLYQTDIINYVEDRLLFDRWKETFYHDPIIISVEDDSRYYFLKTGTLKVPTYDDQIYFYDKHSNEVKDTHMDLANYLVDVAKRYANPHTNISRSELLLFAPPRTLG